MGRPATGKTPGQHFRLPQTYKDKLAEVARTQHRTMTDVLVEALRQYFDRYDRRISRAASDLHGEEQT